MFHLRLTALAALLSAGGSPAAITVAFEKKAYKVGDEVRLVVTGAPKVVVGSDLKRASFEAATNRPVPAGKIDRPGLYQFTATAGQERPTAALLVVPAAGDPLLFGPATFAPAPVDFGKKLQAELTFDNCKEAGRRALPKWAKTNLASLGQATVVCGLCATPLAEAAVPLCMAALGDLAADFAQTFAEELADLLVQKGALQPQHATLFKAALKIGNAVQVLRGAADPVKRMESALAGAKLLTAEIEHEGVRLGLTYLIDQTGKVVVLLKLSKK
jgi:hypothetical protein